MDAGVSTGRVLTAIVAALHTCDGNTLRGHVHVGSVETMADLVASMPALEPAAVTCLREVIRRQVLVGLPVGEALEALQCVSTVLDELFTHAVEKHARALESLAYGDELTGLANRRAATSALRSALANATRHDRPLVVVAVDVDHLKTVNDVEGHDAGDRVLQRIAAAFRDGLRDGDSAFRMGGDEFLIILPETELDQVDQLMKRVEAQGAPPFSYGAASTHEAVSPTEIVRLADQRLLTGRRLARQVPPVTSVPLVPRRRRGIGDTVRVAAVVAGIMSLGAAVALGASPVTDYVRRVVYSKDQPTHLSLPPRRHTLIVPTTVPVAPPPVVDPVGDPSATLPADSPPAPDFAAIAASRVAPSSTTTPPTSSTTSTTSTTSPSSTTTTTSPSGPSGPSSPSSSSSPSTTTTTPTTSAPATRSRTESARRLSVEDDSVTSDERDIVIPVLRNDSAGGSTFDLTTLTVADAPSDGRATVRSDGTISYRARGAIGDTFDYSICTADGRCGRANVAISAPHQRQEQGGQQRSQPSSTSTAGTTSTTISDDRRD